VTFKIDSASVASGDQVPGEMRERVARLVEQAQVDGIQLTGEGGLLPDMIKQVVEAALQGEMTAISAMSGTRPRGVAAATPATR
jgi:deoxyhypusine synthase